VKLLRHGTRHHYSRGGLPRHDLLTERYHRRALVDVLDATHILPDNLVRAERCEGPAAKSGWSVCRTVLGGDGGHRVENRGEDYDPFSLSHGSWMLVVDVHLGGRGADICSGLILGFLDVVKTRSLTASAGSGSDDTRRTSDGLHSYVCTVCPSLTSERERERERILASRFAHRSKSLSWR
jgi:hypothetical protein